MTWNESTLGDICDAGQGIIKTGPFGSQLHQSDYSDAGTPVVMPKDIVGGRVSESSIARVAEEHVERLSHHQLHPGDIVYGRRGDIGRCALVTPRESGWLCGTGCLRIHLGDGEVSPKFLFYFLNNPSTVDWIYNQAVGATMPNLNTGILRSIPVRYPARETQERIAAFLSAYDDLIENNTRRIEILEEMARRLYEEWFVHYRFPGHEEVSFKESELGRIPEGWEIANLEEIVDLTMGQSPKSEFYNDTGKGLPFHQGVTDFGNYFPSNRLYCTVENRIAEEGDILFSVRAPVGRINISKEKIVIGRGISALRSKAGYQVFLLSQLRKTFEEEDSIGNGAIFKAVTKKDMQTIKLLQPDVRYIDSFESIAGSLWKQIRVLSDKNINLRAQRDLLLPKLVSGEIDVSDIPVPEGKEVEAA